MSQFAPLLIRASAGTGKTFQLSNRFISLLSKGESPDKILATTFTRKAAHEISERIFDRLADAACSEEKAQEIGQFIHDPSFHKNDASKILVNLVKNQHRLKIVTLDSFFISFARAFAFELGLDKNWKILDDSADKALIADAVQSLCRNLGVTELLQLLKILHQAGSKRSVHNSITQIVINLHSLYLDTEVSAWNWLKAPVGLTSDELKRIQEQLQAVEVPKTKSGTPNKNWQKALTQMSVFIKDEDWEELISKGICGAIREKKDTYYNAEIPSDIYDISQKIITQAKFHLLTMLREQSLALYHILNTYNDSYSEIKKNTAGLRFADVKFLLSEAGIQNNLDEIFYRLDSRVHHLLLDEFQDTSNHEWNILEPFVTEILSKTNDEHSFFCVGDVKQAIYGWRGGVSEIFDTLEESFPHLELETMDLSFRSSDPVITTVNTIFASIKDSPEIPLSIRNKWDSYFTPHDSFQKSLVGYVECNGVPLTSDEDGTSSMFSSAVKKVKELYSQNSDVNIGVLVRTNSDVARLMYLLSEEEIPASEEGGNPIVDSPAVILLLNLLTLLDHPGDSIALYHVVHSKLAKLLQFDGRHNAKEYNSKNNYIKISYLRLKLSSVGYGTFLRDVTSELMTDLNKRDKRRVLQFIELGYAFDLQPQRRVSDFISYIKGKKIEDPESKNVRVMTVHQSKGLEFDAVVLPGLDKKLVKNRAQSLVLTSKENPLSKPSKVVPASKNVIRSLEPQLEGMMESEQKAKYNEELCVLYVALTRAKNALYIFTAQETDLARPSAASLIFDALCGVEKFDKETFYSYGNKEWVPKKIVNTAVDHSDFEVVPERISFVPRKARERMLPRKSPSKLEGGGEIDLKKIFEPKRNEAALRGIVLHGLFEKIEWFNSDSLDIESIEKCISQYGLPDNFSQSLSQEFLEMFQRSQLKEIFSKERYQKFKGDIHVKREYPFIYRDSDNLMKGFIDRFVYIRDSSKIQYAEIIDFKTDRTSDLDERVDYYRPQLEAYKEAIKKSINIEIENITSTLVFVSRGLIYNV